MRQWPFLSDKPHLTPSLFPMHHLAGLAAQWRLEAETHRTRYADPSKAALCDAHADELEAALKVEAVEELSLPEATAVCGYSESHLRALIASGEIPNVGRKHRPRVRRQDLPYKSRKIEPAPMAKPTGKRRSGPRPHISR